MQIKINRLDAPAGRDHESGGTEYPPAARREAGRSAGYSSLGRRRSHPGAGLTWGRPATTTVGTVSSPPVAARTKARATTAAALSPACVADDAVAPWAAR
jgi:hypothetical protein